MVLGTTVLIKFIFQAIGHYETAADYYKGEGSSRYAAAIFFELPF